MQAGTNTGVGYSDGRTEVIHNPPAPAADQPITAAQSDPSLTTTVGRPSQSKVAANDAAQALQDVGPMGWCCGGSALLVIVLIVVAAMKPIYCQLCQTPIKRKSYNVVIRGKGYTVCPNCSSNIAKRNSKSAVDRLYGG